jgi:serine/threonine protein phosphatase PrpC
MPWQKACKAKGSCYGATDIGKKRDGNEDCYLLMPELNIYMVADGMGGHNAGEVASLSAVKRLAEYFTAECVLKMNGNHGSIEAEMMYAVMAAHERVMEMSKNGRGYRGMGCTIAVSFIHDRILHTCHVGDSRVYVINSSNITQITRDHSTVAELVRIGEMTREEARHSPLRGEITQALGAITSIKPEYNRTYALNKDDVVLLCSDGLWEMLSDDEIQSIVAEKQDMKRACKELIHRANAAGGNDNITAVLVRI